MNLWNGLAAPLGVRVEVTRQGWDGENGVFQVDGGVDFVEYVRALFVFAVRRGVAVK